MLNIKVIITPGYNTKPLIIYKSRREPRKNNDVLGQGKGPLDKGWNKGIGNDLG